LLSAPASSKSSRKPLGFRAGPSGRERILNIRPFAFDASPSDRLDRRQIERHAFEVRVRCGNEAGELSRGAAHVTQRFVFGKVESLRQKLRIAGRNAGHRVHELLEVIASTAAASMPSDLASL